MSKFASVRSAVCGQDGSYFPITLKIHHIGAMLPMSGCCDLLAIIGRAPTPPLAQADIPAQCEAMSKPKNI